MGLFSDVRELIAAFIVLILGIYILQAFVTALNFNWGSILVALFAIVALYMIMKEVS
jgi:hypothetical protein